VFGLRRAGPPRRERQRQHLLKGRVRPL